MPQARSYNVASSGPEQIPSKGVLSLKYKVAYPQTSFNFSKQPPCMPQVWDKIIINEHSKTGYISSQQSRPKGIA